MITNRPRGRRNAKTASETKSLILKAAIKLFSRYGYEKVSIRSISNDIGITHTSIHHHFGGKDEIWSAVINYVYRHECEYALSLLSTMNPALSAGSKLYLFFTRLTAYQFAFPYSSRLMLESMRLNSEQAPHHVLCRDVEIDKALEELVSQYNDPQLYKSVSSEKTTLNELKWSLLTQVFCINNMQPVFRQLCHHESQSGSCLIFRQWQVFNLQLAEKFSVPQQERLSPDTLEHLLLGEPSLL